MNLYQCCVSLPFYSSDDTVGVTFNVETHEGLVPVYADGVLVGKASVSRQVTVGYLFEHVDLSVKMYLDRPMDIEALRSGNLVPQPVATTVEGVERIELFKLV